VNGPDILSALVPIGQFLGALSAIAAIATFYWSNVRLPARRLGIVDLATKQIAFWDQTLKLELAATTDNDKQQEARDRAYAAVQRIRSHADVELERSSWPERANEIIFQSRSSVLNMRRPPDWLRTSQKIDWYLLKIMCWVMFFLALTLMIVFVTAVMFPPHRIRNFGTAIEGVVYISTSSLLGRYFGLAAERLACPGRPQRSVLDKI
jgi:hypothetical protein